MGGDNAGGMSQIKTSELNLDVAPRTWRSAEPGETVLYLVKVRDKSSREAAANRPWTFSAIVVPSPDGPGHELPIVGITTQLMYNTSPNKPRPTYVPLEGPILLKPQRNEHDLIVVAVTVHEGAHPGQEVLIRVGAHLVTSTFSCEIEGRRFTVDGGDHRPR